MRKILFIIVMAVSAFTFTGCNWLCKKCPECPQNRPTSASKTLNYYFYVIDTLKPNSPFEKYIVQINNLSPEVIVPGNSFNITYNPTTEKDSVSVKVDAVKKSDGSIVNMSNYIMPIYWEESNNGDTLFMKQIFYNPSSASVGGPPTGGIQDPVCVKRCN